MVNILLIGDSLTEGYYAYGMKFHSYAEKMEELLYRHFPSTPSSEQEQNGIHLPFLIHQRGVSGECTDEIAMRLNSYLHRAEEKGSGYDIVCVLGGTNDLGDDVPNPAEICQNLQAMYEQVKKHNSNSLLVLITIPEGRCVDEDYVAARRKVNSWILQYGSADSNVVHVDLEHLLPHFKPDSKPLEVDVLHWDDALHMTVKGYDKFGELVFAAIQPHFAKFISK